MAHLAVDGVQSRVGPPGEDEHAFANTCSLLEELPLSYLHVFPYSRRPGTPACDYPDPVAADVIKERSARVRSIGAAKKDRFMRSALGRRSEILVETRRDTTTGLLKGLTRNYLNVLLEGDDHLMNTIVAATIDTMNAAGVLMGRIEP